MAVETVREEDVLNVILCRTSAGGCLRGTYRRTELQVSIKLLSSRTAGRSEWTEWMRDVDVVRQVHSERVLVPLGVYKAWCLMGLLYDWMPEGSLHSLLYQTQLYPGLPMSFRLGILLDVAEGLCHLHCIPLPHQALKPTNVLLDEQYRAKVSDWGLPREWRVGSSLSAGGGPCFRDLVYLSPEALTGTTPSVEADMYSFGVLLWETLNRRQPCGDLLQLLSGEDGVDSGLEDELLPKHVPHCHTLSQLMNNCWSTNPHSRPTAEDCALELRSAIATFDPDAMTRAILRVRESKERALHDSKIHPVKDIPIEINNLEACAGSGDTKCVGNKTLPLPQTTSPSETLPSPPTAIYTGEAPQRRHCQDCVTGSVVSSSSPTSPRCPSSGPVPEHPRGTGCVSQGQRQSLPPPLSSSPSKALRQSPLNQPTASSHAAQCVTPMAVSCCRILRERREGIIRGMTEGRLNNLLDVLISRRALPLEAYEVISASLTLTARTRSLLDTCACLGEHAASLVATTLGLMSITTNCGPPQMSH
ncbi:receptor-interacting serine/threonine-protein kinase 2 isoform X2 [Coregonus clupeaformis]|uniref:receptor-interacting serine/threonine-protein kinase 2 isoform X2 n=1 Tax=Coregonus clupeaformis TaxID=59861 RepID=UPI001E1C9C62|nr:receptor-interacting serine/threonine-protein kinase 2 isoform X2 [Coregonus clupeaformis]